MKIRFPVSFCLILFFCLATVGAQSEKATLRGTVSDPSGAIIPGADIVVTDLATNIDVRRILSDSNGNFEMPDLKPGMYRVKVVMTGFRPHIADSLKLDPGQVRRLDIVLAIGSTSETATVVAGAATIQTETGTISGEPDQKKFLDRPLVDVYPSPLALMTTMPGIQGNGWNIVMSGISDRNQQTWAMDGVANDTAGDQAVKAIGLQGVNPKGYTTEGFPDMTISGITGVTAGGSGGINNVDVDNGINTFVDNLTWSKGKHILKFGAEYRQFWWRSAIINRQVYGAFNFTGQYSGIGFADFLLGIPNQSQRLEPLANRPNSNKQLGFFVNDSFKVSQNLTIDGGLRWDYYALPTYDDGLMSN